ncbi:hypothetical protein CFC21_014102 [Triticum aestivum]|uniref:Ribosomal protein S3 n=2 Tax=Triticum aestivum TaxID=4565 RepID=A0A9R1IYY1_WHEAT|nr:hypothetical protein CFC21_014102 [Triticum aestivum]
MGQKINPLGFRLGTTQKHHSFWFAQPKNYSEGLQEDKKIRDCIKNYIQKNRKKGSNRKIEFKFRSNYTYRNPKRNRYDPRHNPYWIPKFIKEKRSNRRIRERSTKGN